MSSRQSGFANETIDPSAFPIEVRSLRLTTIESISPRTYFSDFLWCSSVNTIYEEYCIVSTRRKWCYIASVIKWSPSFPSSYLMNLLFSASSFPCVNCKFRASALSCLFLIISLTISVKFFLSKTSCFDLYNLPDLVCHTSPSFILF